MFRIEVNICRIFELTFISIFFSPCFAEENASIVAELDNIKTPTRKPSDVTVAPQTSSVEVTPTRDTSDLPRDDMSPLFSCTQESGSQCQVVWDWDNKGNEYFKNKASRKAGEW